MSKARMSDVHASCMILCASMEDGVIDFDEAIEILSEEFAIQYDEAAGFLYQVCESE